MPPSPKETPTRKPEPVLAVQQHVEFAYPSTPDVRFRVPAGLTLRAGQACCIRGISGYGKSTMMALLAGLRQFPRGCIQYHFPSPPDSPLAPTWTDQPFVVRAESWSRVVGPSLWSRIGFAFQRPELIDALDVIGNLELAGIAPEGHDLFGSDEWSGIAGSGGSDLSGGQIQRIALIRAFAPGRDLVFLDEPTNNLDIDNRDQVAEFLARRRQGRAVVVVSHDEDFLTQLDLQHVFEIHQRHTRDAGGRPITLRTLVRSDGLRRMPPTNGATGHPSGSITVPSESQTSGSSQHAS